VNAEIQTALSNKILFSSCLTEITQEKRTKFFSFMNQLCKYFARAFYLWVGEANKKC
jgi:hypothetical protein